MSSAAAPQRRTHAERTALMRERVMLAVVEVIADVGFARTTAAEIARRAGVTWGAVQHHFGDKDGILMAVLEESFSHFADELGEVGPRQSREHRAGLFVDRGWAHFSGPRYQSTFEILLNLPAETELPWQREMLKQWHHIWSQYFPESNPAEQETVELMLYTVSVLTGLASTQILGGNPARSRDRELGMLKETLVRELRRGTSTS